MWLWILWKLSWEGGLKPERDWQRGRDTKRDTASLSHRDSLRCLGPEWVCFGRSGGWKHGLNIEGRSTPRRTPSNRAPHHSNMGLFLSAPDSVCVRGPPHTHTYNFPLVCLPHLSFFLMSMVSWNNREVGKVAHYKLQQPQHWGIHWHACGSKCSAVPPGSAEDQPSSNHPQEWVVNLTEQFEGDACVLVCLFFVWILYTLFPECKSCVYQSCFQLWRTFIKKNLQDLTVMQVCWDKKMAAEISQLIIWQKIDLHSLVLGT